MIGIASLPKEEREELFLNTAAKVGMPPAIGIFRSNSGIPAEEHP